MESEQNDKAEVTPAERWIAISISILFVSFFLILMGLISPFRIVFLLCVGWTSFILRTLSRLTISPSLTLMFLSSLLLFAVGFHFYCRRIKGKVTAESAGVTSWQKRWSFSLVTMFLLLAVSGICVISVTHQLFWMATTQDRIFIRLHMGGAGEAARRSTSKNNLKQIGLAMHNYHESARRFPMGGTFDKTGQPQHSWITQLLPYLDHKSLYDQIDFNQSWTAADNREPFETNFILLQSPGMPYDFTEEEGDAAGYKPAHYAANSRVLSANSGMDLRKIKDGSSNTILAGEVRSGIKAWGDPTNFRDPTEGINRSPRGFGSKFKGGTHVLLSDGMVRFVSEDIDPSVLKALSTPNGGEPVGEF
ncbi:DUF1559 domain-containing protein [Gimesia algae]|uniref:DUF1559 domain-containing protein n=1 Tax=Gimesia algae TaxID=2527971 RepID=A0A517V672_9PLAN|nr:DUF1559 domain-containing protein [Gimesia algae]QDT88500.1 hypothetical protein Pan161_01160 [Gimesia algae]